jgi:hypothetical protein
MNKGLMIFYIKKDCIYNKNDLTLIITDSIDHSEYSPPSGSKGICGRNREITKNEGKVLTIMEELC